MSVAQNLGVVTGQNGKSFASGTLTPGDEDVQVTTGLATVDHCGVSLAGVPAYNDHMFSVALPGTLDGDIQILSYEATATDNVTPTASTSNKAVTWWAVGDR
jgi:hypothetical protein